MSSTTTIPTLDPPQPGDAQAYYQQLFDSLKLAYRAATTIEAKNQIFETRETVFEILTAISQAKLDGDTEQIDALADTVEENNDELKKLQASINTIVTDTQVAAKLISSITHVLALAGDFL